jgi:hypothetical protein
MMHTQIHKTIIMMTRTNIRKSEYAYLKPILQDSSYG